MINKAQFLRKMQRIFRIFESFMRSTRMNLRIGTIIQLTYTVEPRFKGTRGFFQKVPYIEDVP